ncbi:unnamed protein product [Alternaria alternata]
MAEVLAVLGGAAALTQLIHYGFLSVSTISALSYNIRHTADKIDTWIDQSLLMTTLIDDIDYSIRNHTPNTVQLLAQCRKDAARLNTLLATCRKYMPSQKRSKAAGTVFVIRKEEEVERIMLSYRNNFNILASYLAMVNLSRNTTQPKPSVRTELETSGGRLQHIRPVLRTLNIEFDVSFTRSQDLQRGHDLHVQVSAVLETTMQYPVNPLTFAETAALTVRFCMYLMMTGCYLRVLYLLVTFKAWSRDVLPAYFETDTTLSGKEITAQTLRGELDTALPMLHSLHRSRTKSLGRSDIRTLHSVNGLGLMYHTMGNNLAAMHHHQSALRLKSKRLGRDDPDTLISANNLGIVLISQGEHEKAEDLFDRSLKGWLQAYGADDLFVIAARSNIGIALHFQGKLDEAEYSHRYVYKKRHQILGPHHHETVKSQANLAITLNEQGHHTQAETLYRQALAIFQDKLGVSHPDTLKTHTNLATALHDQGKFNEAESVVASAIPLLRKKFDVLHPEVLEALEFRAILLQHIGKFSKALGIARQLYEARENKLGYDHDDTQRSLQHVRDLAEDMEEAHVMRRFPLVVPVAVF